MNKHWPAGDHDPQRRRLDLRGADLADRLHAGALIAAGLVLFVPTLLVNAAARAFVARFEGRAA